MALLQQEGNRREDPVAAAADARESPTNRIKSKPRRWKQDGARPAAGTIPFVAVFVLKEGKGKSASSSSKTTGRKRQNRQERARQRANVLWDCLLSTRFIVCARAGKRPASDPLLASAIHHRALEELPCAGGATLGTVRFRSTWPAITVGLARRATLLQRNFFFSLALFSNFISAPEKVSQGVPWDFEGLSSSCCHRRRGVDAPCRHGLLQYLARWSRGWRTSVKWD